MENDKQLIADLVKALTDLFEQCCMIHRYGGEISNQKEADAAIEFAKKTMKRAMQS